MSSFSRHAGIVALLLSFLVSVGHPSTASAEDAPSKSNNAAGKKTASPKRRSMLWVVGGTPRAYIYGTVVSRDPRVGQHPSVVQAAFKQSSALYTEIRLDSVGHQQMQMVMMAKAAAPDAPLSKVLGPDLHGRVRELLPPGVPLPLLENMKPWFLNSVLQQSLFQVREDKRRRLAVRAAKARGGDVKKADISAPVFLDTQFYVDAVADGKQVGALESVDSYFDAFDSLSSKVQVAMVGRTARLIRKAKDAAKRAAESGGEEKSGTTEQERTIASWLAGDAPALAALLESHFRVLGGSEGKSLVENALHRRTASMVAKILELMKAHPDKTFFFPVPGGYLSGEKGMLKALRKAGLKIRRLELDADLPATPKKSVAPKR